MSNRSRAWGAALIWMVPALALATSTQAGAKVFGARCATCHTAAPPVHDGDVATKRVERRRKPVGPDLVQVLRTKPREEVRTWIADPWQVNPGTSCDPRGVTAVQLGHLLQFLEGRTKPLSPPREARQRAALEDELEKLKNRGNAGNPRKGE